MLNEAASKHTFELTQSQGPKMNNNYVTALKIAALGGKLSEAQIKSLKVSEGMRAVLESQESAQAFMRKIVESKKAMLAESEIATAQTTLAAQDIADQIQSMIEKLADIKYKELPALQDSIRNAQGVEQADSFNTQLTSSLDSLNSALEQARGDVNNAVAELTGQEVAGGAGDLDVDAFGAGDDMGMGGDDMGMGGDDLGMGDEMGDELGGDEFDLDLETDDDEVDLGRERR